MIDLLKKGDTHSIILQKSGVSNYGTGAQVKMIWKTAVDLDLHAYAIDNYGEFIHVYFANKKSYCSNIILDQDAGVGNIGGDNEENLTVRDLSKVKKIIFVANIFRFFGNLFSSGDKFSSYDGRIEVRTMNETVNVCLNSSELGRWAIIALIENINGTPVIKNIDSIIREEPSFKYLSNL